MTDRNTYDLSNRVFALLAIVGAGMILFWAFRMTEIWTTVSGGYVREISVEGEGTAYIIPDTAVISLGVTTDGETSAAVVEENTTNMNAVLEAIKAQGIAEEDIKTTGYYLSPSYEYDDDWNYTETGYTLDQTVEVRLTDFEKIGALLAATSTAGANYIGGVNFTVDNPDSAKAEAREEAIARAKEKAEQIAKQSGLKLGDLVSYYEYSYSDGGKGGYLYDYSEDLSSYSAPSIEPGEEEVTLTVTLSYQIR